MTDPVCIFAMAEVLNSTAVSFEVMADFDPVLEMVMVVALVKTAE